MSSNSCNYIFKGDFFYLCVESKKTDKLSKCSVNEERFLMFKLWWKLKMNRFEWVFVCFRWINYLCVFNHFLEFWAARGKFFALIKKFHNILKTLFNFKCKFSTIFKKKIEIVNVFHFLQKLSSQFPEPEKGSTNSKMKY